eukprot:2891196-Pleurochrysis_carterae.AAC.2
MATTEVRSKLNVASVNEWLRGQAIDDPITTVRHSKGYDGRHSTACTMQCLGRQLHPIALRSELPLLNAAAGMSNPTYLLTTVRNNKVVLRRKPDGALLPSAHDVLREHRVMLALQVRYTPSQDLPCSHLMGRDRCPLVGLSASSTRFH